MKSELYFLQFNNYYNRKLIKHNSIDDYAQYIVGTVVNTDFKPNDWVYTTVKGVKIFDDDTFQADYMLQCQVVNGQTQIQSRWWIIDATKIGNEKYDISLFRDTLADYLDELQNAPIFVEKAMLPASSPLIFNQEDMTFNQIRQEPRLLGDRTNMPWIVGYIPRDSFKENKQIVADMNIHGTADIEVKNVSDWSLYTYTNPRYYQGNAYIGFNYGIQKNAGFIVNRTDCSLISRYTGISGYNPATSIVDTVDTWSDDHWQKMRTFAHGFYNDNSFFQDTYYYYPIGSNDYQPKNSTWNTYNTNLRSNTLLKSYVDGYIQSSYWLINDVEFEELKEVNNKILYDSNADRYYRIVLNIEANEDVRPIGFSEPSITSAVTAVIPAVTGGERTNNTFTIRYDSYKVSLDLVQVQSKVFVNIDNDRYHLEDQPYDMFCIPYGNIKMVTGANSYFNARNPGTAIASEIAAYAGTNSVYDVQLLPYCPIQGLITEDNELDLTKSKHDLIYEVEGKLVSAIIWCTQSSFSFNIPFSIPDIQDPIKKKIASQTEVYRLVSPNYSGMFEFNPYKNGGVDYLRVDCSYKPFNPFIKLAPVFKGLYGKGGLYDGRGLILGGDFSLTQLSNAWANYELQNKNYQAMFDRQIQNMEVTNNYQKISDIAGAVTGSVSAGISGAMIGAMAGTSGGAAGAVIGGVAGGAGGIGLGIADLFMKDKLRNEAMDYTKDNFGYNLGNIQALPTSLTKTAALTINNPVIPMLDTYTCTDEEKAIFYNKITYNGMTVMKIDTLSNYTEGYFKGKLIQLGSVTDDYHIVNTIASELYKGVYLT